MKTLLASLGLFLITSCECRRTAVGFIIDEITELPIDGVKATALKVFHGEVLSDSSGLYFFGSIYTSAVGGCPDVSISLSKQGYQTRVVENPGEGNIYLRPN